MKETCPELADHHFARLHVAMQNASERGERECVAYLREDVEERVERCRVELRSAVLRNQLRKGSPFNELHRERKGSEPPPRSPSS